MTWGLLIHYFACISPNHYHSFSHYFDDACFSVHLSITFKILSLGGWVSFNYYHHHVKHIQWLTFNLTCNVCNVQKVIVRSKCNLCSILRHHRIPASVTQLKVQFRDFNWMCTQYKSNKRKEIHSNLSVSVEINIEKYICWLNYLYFSYFWSNLNGTLVLVFWTFF